MGTGVVRTLAVAAVAFLAMAGLIFGFARSERPPAASHSRMAPGAWAVSVPPSDTVLLPDDSASQALAGGADPGQLGRRAILPLARYLAQLSPRGSANRVAIVPFASAAPARVRVPLTAVPSGLPQLEAAVASRVTPGGTDYVAAFRAARETLEASPNREGALREVLLITDGRSNDGSGDSQLAQLSRVGREMNRLPAGTFVHLVVRDAKNRFDERQAAAWRRAGITTIDRLDAGTNLARLLTSLIAKDLGLRGRSLALHGRGDKTSFALPPYQERLVLNVQSGARDTVVRVVAPGGEPTQALAGRLVVGRIEAPDPGTWSLQLDRGDDARVRVDRVPPDFHLVEPQLEQIGLGYPLRPTVSARRGGRPLDSRGFAAVSVTLTKPDGTAIALPADRPRSGVSSVRRAHALDALGRYSLRAELRVHGTTITSDVRSFEVVNRPFVLTSVAQTGAHDLQIDATVERAGAALRLEDVFDLDPSIAAVATVVDAEGHIRRAYMDLVAPNRLRARFNGLPAAAYRATVDVDTRSGGRRFQGHDWASARINEPPSSFVAVWGPRAGGGFCATLLVALLAFLVFRRTRPAMDARLMVGRQSVAPAGARMLIVGHGWPMRPVIFVFALRGMPVSRCGRLPLPWGCEPVPLADDPRTVRPMPRRRTA